MAGNTISKSLQTIFNAATGGVPDFSTSVLLFAPTAGTRLVTNANKCTVAQLVSGAGLAIPANRVPFGNGTGLTSAAGFTCDGTTLVVPVSNPGTIQPTTAYKSVDGSTGETAAINTGATPNLTVKNGLITAHA